MPASNSPISFLPYDWWIRIGGSYEHRWFQGADPDTTAGQSRLDKVWHAEIANVIPITDSWRLTQQFDYDQVNSNERTSDYHNYAASLLATWQF